MRLSLKQSLPLATACLLGLVGAAALADSTSSASSAASTSLGSSSTSLEKSSGSSSSKDKVAQGHFTVVDIAAVDHRPDLLRVRMQALAPSLAPELILLLPRQTAERVQLAAGRTIAAEHRPYGLAFATVNTAGRSSPFFLVLDDDWYRELHGHPVVL